MAPTYATFQAYAATSPGGFAALVPWSQNDARTAAAINSAFATYAQAFVDACHAAGIVPILMTLQPTANITNSTDDAARLSVNTSIRAMAASDVIVADVAPTLGNGASPERIISTYSVDGAHANAAGAALLAPVVQSAIQAYLSTH